MRLLLIVIISTLSLNVRPPGVETFRVGNICMEIGVAKPHVIDTAYLEHGVAYCIYFQSEECPFMHLNMASCTEFNFGNGPAAYSITTNGVKIDGGVNDRWRWWRLSFLYYISLYAESHSDAVLPSAPISFLRLLQKDSVLFEYKNLERDSTGL